MCKINKIKKVVKITLNINKNSEIIFHVHEILS